MKFKKISLILFLFVFVVSIVNHTLKATTLTTQWQKTYALNWNNRIEDTKQALDGGYINVGRTSVKYGIENGYMLKTDANGEQVWAKQFGGANDDMLLAVLPTNDGGYIAVGTSSSFTFASEPNQQVGWILRVDASGNEVYSKPYRNQPYAANQVTNFLVLHDIIKATDGGYIMVGEAMIAGKPRGIVVKIDEDGNEQWHQTTGHNTGYLESVIATDDGGYILAGAASKDENGNDSVSGIIHGLLMKIDADGNQVWYQLYQDGGNHIQAIAKTTDGNYIATGPTYSIQTATNASWVLKVNPDGTPVWMKTYSHVKWLETFGIVATDDGGGIMVGDALSAIDGYQMVGERDAMLIRFDSNGEIEWEKQMGLARLNTLYTVIKVTNGYVASGFGGAPNDPEVSNGWLIKFSNAHTLSFDLNGGESEAIGDQVLFENELASEVQNPTRSGYDFIGWNTAVDGSGTSWDFTSSKMPFEDVKLYAQWQAQNVVTTYTLSFDLNGAPGTAPTSIDVEAESLVSAPEVPIYDGYDFIGWYTTSDGTGEMWDFASTKMPANDVTLYAQWQKHEDVVTYALQFDLNGAAGTQPTSQQLKAGELAIEPPVPTQAGYDFKGWNTSRDGSGEIWNFASKTMPTYDVTLYAQWQKHKIVTTYALQFDLNGASGVAPTTQKIEAGALASRVSIPTRDMYRFNGWNTKADGSGYSWDFTKTTMPSHDVTLYAQWKKDDIVKANTGDTTNIGLWMLVLSGSLLVSVLIVKKRNNR